MSYSTDENREKFIILLLGVTDRPVPSLLHLQKELFVFSKTNPKVDEYFRFGKHYEGPYSQVLQELAREPIHYENAYTFGNGGIHLTKCGKELYRQITEKHEDNERFNYLLSSLKLIRTLYDKLSRDEMLLLIYATYPAFTELSNVYEGIMNDKKKKNILVKGLLRKGLITPERSKEL